MKIEAPINGYDIDVMVVGFPGKTVCHGGLGWSTIVLLRGRGRIALVDTGGFGLRVFWTSGQASSPLTLSLSRTAQNCSRARTTAS